jgi:hypothetical protein
MTRQQHIDAINHQAAAAGFKAKDFFLTQPPAPDKKESKTAYFRWKRREVRRRQIAQRMYRYGLTAHDLVQDSSKPNAISPRG